MRQEIDDAFATNPSFGANLFREVKKRFLAEAWTTNHFQSVESKDLLIQLNTYFRGRDGAPPVESSLPKLRTEAAATSAFSSSRMRNQDASKTKVAQERERRRNLKALFWVAAALLLGFLILLIRAGPVPEHELPAELRPQP